jgi:hypothetical protein
VKTIKILAVVIFLLSLFMSCAAQNNSIGKETFMEGRYAEMKQEEQSFSVNLIPPENGRALWEGKQLEDPYSVRVRQGKTYQIEIDTQDGTTYKGNIQVIGPGGSVGRYQGYDVRLSGYIMQMLKHDKQVSFYLNSPDGKQVLLVTFFAP